MQKKRSRKTGVASGKKGAVKKADMRKLIAVAAGAVVVIYFAYTLISQQVLINKKNKEIDALQVQITEANEEADKLKSELENLQDPEYIEKIAREKLGLVRPNERVFVDSNKSDDNAGN